MMRFFMQLALSVSEVFRMTIKENLLINRSHNFSENLRKPADVSETVVERDGSNADDVRPPEVTVNAVPVQSGHHTLSVTSLDPDGKLAPSLFLCFGVMMSKCDESI